MDFPGAARNPRFPALHGGRRRSRAATVELAAATAVWLAPDYVLAGARAARAVPDPLRRSGGPRLPIELPSPARRALAALDARGARAVPRRDAGAVRLRPVDEREQGAVNLIYPLESSRSKEDPCFQDV